MSSSLHSASEDSIPPATSSATEEALLPPPPRPTIFQRVGSYFRAHPVICLLLLTPGIPEYLSGSSPVAAIVLNPFQFLFQILANLGLYGPGVLLIREAKIQWGKGWATVLFLGAAYGILEEGIALSTLFDPNANPVGQLGFYGHWLGVNWVWVAGILPVHMIYSISLPILLLGLALPETKGKLFLETKKKILATFLLLGCDVTALFLLILLGEHFWMGVPVFLSSFVAIGGLVFLAYKAPPNLLSASSEVPRKKPLTMGIIGALFYTAVLLCEFLPMGAKVPSAIDFALVVLIQGLFLVFVLKNMGHANNERNLIAFTLGLLLPIMTFGVVSQLSLPIPVILVDLLLFMFLRGLWKKYSIHGATEVIDSHPL